MSAPAHVTATPTAARPPAALDVDDLHITFAGRQGNVHALRGASLTIDPGEIVGLVGESGSGKSVLGLAALGLLPQQPKPLVSGRVLLGGDDMVAASEEQRRAYRGRYITAVFQDPMGSLNPSMRIGAQLSEAAAGASADELAGMLAGTGIPEPEVKLRCYPHELSGGLRQRVMIAMAMARNPRLVVADEPTTALDVTVQARVLDLLATAAREHDTALLLITHDLGVAARICDRIAVAYAGRIVEAATTAQILLSAKHPYARGLLSSRPRLDGLVAGGDLPTLAGAPPDPRAPAEGCAFRPRCPAATTACARPAPVTVDGGRRCECHHPGAVTTWPASDAPRERSRVLLGHLTDARPSTPRPEIAPQALVLENVTCEFPRPRRHPFAAAREPLLAVGGVDLTLRSGGALAVVGESGSGKTTLLRMTVGLLTPTSGTVTLGPGAPPQLVFQDAGASLTPWLSIGRQIEERLAALGVPREGRQERVHATLEAVGLPPEAAPAVARQLSGGMRQRAAIARAIAVPPALLACDEPVSALDVSLASQVLNLLCDLRAKLGIALLFVTHDLVVARAVADEVAVMRDGVIVERGSTDQIFEAPEHPYTRELLAAVPHVAVAA